MKISKRQLRRIINEEKQRLVKEANPDGTVSDDEDGERDDLMMSVEMQMDELIEYIQTMAYTIGGPYRAPGIKAEAFRRIADKMHKVRLEVIWLRAQYLMFVEETT